MYEVVANDALAFAHVQSNPRRPARIEEEPASQAESGIEDEAAAEEETATPPA
jgi:hypothetical protein